MSEKETIITEGVIDCDLEGYVEPQIVKDLSRPYTLEIVSIDTRIANTERGERTVVDVNFRVTDSGLDNVKMVNDSFWPPHANDPADLKNSSKGKIIRFKSAFGDSSGGFDINYLRGRTAQATLKKATDDYGEKNKIKKWL